MDKQRGILVSWKPLKGFGRVAINQHSFFIHAKQIVKAPEQIVPGMVVYFDIAPPAKLGQNPQAIQCVIEEIEDAGGVE